MNFGIASPKLMKENKFENAMYKSNGIRKGTFFASESLAALQRTFIFFIKVLVIFLHTMQFVLGSWIGLILPKNRPNQKVHSICRKNIVSKLDYSLDRSSKINES